LFLAAEILLAGAAGCLLLLLRTGPAPVFFVLCGLAGLGVGMQFPLCATVLTDASSGRRAGLTAALDLLGGFLGALLVTVFLVPVLGLGLTALAVVVLKLVSAGSQTLAGLLASGSRIDSNQQAV
jgi:predicted membrane-bound spermidine synthase